jgi:hypothetical protein
VHTSGDDWHEVQQPDVQATYGALHVFTHLVPSHDTVEFAGPAGQAVHDAPQVCTELLVTHWPEQTWLPVGHVAAMQVDPLQVVVLAFVGHSAQVVPQVR